MCQMEVVLLQGRRPGDASVENVGIKVRSVRPNYGTQLRIDAELGEVGGIAQRLEDSVEAEIGREIDHALNAIFEPKMQATIRVCRRSRCYRDAKIVSSDLSFTGCLRNRGAVAGLRHPLIVAYGDHGSVQPWGADVRAIDCLDGLQ